MIAKIKIELGEVQKTLLLPLLERARESDKPDPLIRDNFARDIVGKLDFDFNLIADARPGYSSDFNPTIARAFSIDQTLIRLIGEHPDLTVVNIGAGLDTTFCRVDNGKIHWYDLDFPDTIALRRKLIPESERNEYIAKSILDKTWYKDIKVRGSKVFFMASGVLCYVKLENVKGLLLDLAEEFPGSEIMFDIMSRFLVLAGNIQRWRKIGLGKSAYMKWGLGSARKFRTLSKKVRVLEDYPIFTKVPVKKDWDQRTLSQIKMMNAFGWFRIARLGLG